MIMQAPYRRGVTDSRPRSEGATSLAEVARRVGLAAGLDRVGITTADPFPEVEQTLHRRRAGGLHGGLTFTYNRPRRSTDVAASFPWARSLVVAGHAYLPLAGSPGPPDGASGRVARFAVEDHYAPLRAGLAAVATVLGDAGHRTAILADDNRLVDRAAAVRAGIGWWGKNTMVLAPGTGPWMLLGSVVTDAALDADPPMARDCGTCDACLPACPTGALVAPGVLDARRCLAAVLQQPGSIPAELREAVGDRVYGCDDCLDACPPGHRLLGTATAPAGWVDLAWLLAAPDEEIVAALSWWYLPRRRPDSLRRNALVVAGNTGEPGLAPLVAGYLDHPDEMLAEHARWALDRMSERKGRRTDGGQSLPSGK
jgi:epoxyqueuosine reductase